MLDLPNPTATEWLTVTVSHSQWQSVTASPAVESAESPCQSLSVTRVLTRPVRAVAVQSPPWPWHTKQITRNKLLLSLHRTYSINRMSNAQSTHPWVTERKRHYVCLPVLITIKLAPSPGGSPWPVAGVFVFSASNVRQRPHRMLVTRFSTRWSFSSA